MADAGAEGGSGEILWPERLKRTPVRLLWFDRIRSLPPGLDLQTIADRFGVAKTTAHMWVNTFGYVPRDDRGGAAKKRSETPAAMPAQSSSPPDATSIPPSDPAQLKRVGSFDAIAEDGRRHVILIFQAPDGTPGQPVLFTSFNERVYRVSKGVYQFVATGRRLISKDPQAP